LIIKTFRDALQNAKKSDKIGYLDMKRIVVLGAGESGAGAAVLAKKEGFDVFVSGPMSDHQR
jgi:UDP-N-acetylmuramoylalanine--D-glutamate ligase